MTKIKKALDTIKVQEDGKWFVPNRKMLKMSFDEFIDFEKNRLAEFENTIILQEKYWAHYGLEKPKLEKPKKVKQLSIYD